MPGTPKAPLHAISTYRSFSAEARNGGFFTCPPKNAAGKLDVGAAGLQDASEFDWAWLPVVEVDSRDVLDTLVYVGKGVLKDAWVEG